jgi:hypothetical protein
MTPYKPGDRVVVNIAGPLIGVVRCLMTGDLVVVDALGTTTTLAASEVRPAMPRGKRDVATYGHYWWRDGTVVYVSGARWEKRPTVQTHGGLWVTGLRPKSDWRGPVARPPEVRS